MPNDPFYSTPQWRRTRKAVMARDKGICQLQLVGCTIKAKHVDHIIERSDLPPHSTLHLDPQNLRSLCVSCHNKKTSLKHPPKHQPPSRAW